MATSAINQTAQTNMSYYQTLMENKQKTTAQTGNKTGAVETIKNQNAAPANNTQTNNVVQNNQNNVAPANNNQNNQNQNGTPQRNIDLYA